MRTATVVLTALLAFLAGGAATGPAAEPTGQAGPPMLKVDGNRLKTPDGKVVRLQGVNIASLEWSSTGENVLKSAGVAIDDWRANAIRLPLSQDRWFGRLGAEGPRVHREAPAPLDGLVFPPAGLALPVAGLELHAHAALGRPREEGLDRRRGALISHAECGYPK